MLAAPKGNLHGRCSSQLLFPVVQRDSGDGALPLLSPLPPPRSLAPTDRTNFLLIGLQEIARRFKFTAGRP